MKDTIINYLERIEDPRKERGKRYKLSDILLIALFAVLSGETIAVDMATFTEATIDYFKENYGIEKTPSHDTFSRIMRIINFESLVRN